MVALLAGIRKLILFSRKLNTTPPPTRTVVMVVDVRWYRLSTHSPNRTAQLVNNSLKQTVCDSLTLPLRFSTLS